jgi:hypothetical protein
VYILLVVLQTLVLPLASTVVHLSVAGGQPLVVAAIWWSFWGVGTRLLVAGISQLANPSRTTREILGAENASAAQVVQELGYANLALGAIALVAPFLPWGLLAAAPGALYLGLAGVRHVIKPGKKANELVATWTDLLVFAVVAAGTVLMAVGG